MSASGPSGRALARAVLLLGLLAAGVAGYAVASTTYAQVRAQAATQAAERHEIRGRALADAPPPGWVSDGGPVSYAVKTVWPLPSGGTRTGLVLVPAGTTAGSSVVVWVDPAGRSTRAPLRVGDASATAFGYGLLTAIALGAGAFGAFAAVLAAQGRARSRRWAEEWAAVEPFWTRQFS